MLNHSPHQKQEIKNNFYPVTAYHMHGDEKRPHVMDRVA
jgi:hypothetical protein